MIRKNNKLQEGINSVNRIKLLMGYDMGKTLNENLNEQSMFAGGQGGYVAQDSSKKPKKVKLTPEQLKYQKEHPEMVWDPEAFDDTKPSLNQQGKTVYPKGKFVPITPENVGLRGVPFGFSPVDYPEYLKKVKEINKKYPKSDTSILNPTTWFNSDVDDNREKLLSNLKKEYYHPEFWKGISKEDYKIFQTSKQNAVKEKNRQLDKLNAELRKNKKDIYKDLKTSKDMPGSDRMLDFHNNILKNIAKSTVGRETSANEILTNFEMVDNYINILFDYDPAVFKEMNKTALEKLWEKYEIVGEAVFWLAIDAFTESMAGWVTSARQATVFGKLISAMGGAEKVAAVVRFAGLSGVPIGLGVYDIIRSKKITEESIVYFIFAVLPYAHKFFSVAKPTKEVCESIIRKMSQFNIKTAEGLSGFVKLLTEEEKGLVRKILTMDKSRLESGVKQTIEGISRMSNKEIVNVGKAAGKSISKNYTKSFAKFVGRILIDVSAIEIVKKITLSLGITLDDVKEKELISLLDKFKGNPEYLSILMMNAYFIIQANPNWVISDIVKQSNKDMNTTDVKQKEEIHKNVKKVLKTLKFDPSSEDAWDY